MCDDAGSAHRHDGALSRRRLLQGMVAVAALAGCQPAARSTPRPAARPPSADRLRAYVLGMHLHASASEGQGSMRSQLAEAAANGFDVAWFTEHDWRRRRLLFRPSYSFVPGEAFYGGVWSVDRVPDVGSPAGGSGGGQVPSPVSPNDPATTKASLHLRVTSTGDDPATVGYRVHSEGTSRANFRGRIAGRTVSVDVLPTATGRDSWGEVLFTLSHHPGRGDRPTGVCSLLYRLRSDVTAKSFGSQGTLGIVDLPVTAGQWQSVVLDLVADLHRVWPDVDPRDNSLHDIQLSASSRGRAPAELFYGFLRFEERTGYDAVGVEHDLVAAYADEEPRVLGLVGTEISLGPHLNQFGGPQAPYDYGPITSLDDVPGTEIIPSVVDFVHAQGGLASINHPYAPGDAATAARTIALDLLATGAGGADILEVGYGSFGALPGHLAVWDTLARNGLFVTGNGVSDDHSGQDWAQKDARFYTGTWAGRLSEAGLLEALARGRAYVGYLGSFAGTVDMFVDETVPMGAVSVSPLTSRSLRIDVSGLPQGGAVQVLRGAVDRAGTADPAPNTAVVATLGAGDLGSRTQVPIDTGEDCFHRLQVLDASGAVVAFGQPTWVLKTPPPGGIPPLRRTRE